MRLYILNYYTFLLQLKHRGTQTDQDLGLYSCLLAAFWWQEKKEKICEIITAMHKLWKPPKSWNDLNTLSDIWWLQTFLKSTHKSNLFDLCWKANSISYMCAIFDFTEYLTFLKSYWNKSVLKRTHCVLRYF